MEKKFKVLAINPGSTSTKYGVFEDKECIFEDVIRHDRDELEKCGTIVDQKGLRMGLIVDAIKKAEIDINSFDAIVGRGGIVRPLASGTYTVNDALVKDLQSGSAMKHASALGGLIAREIGDSIGVPSFVVDPVVVDEFCDEARVTGIKGVERISQFHALNQKAVAKRASKELGKAYEKTKLVVAHLGGGISIGAHLYGKVVDVTNGITGEGPFSPERCGAVPAADIVTMCFSGKYTEKDMNTLISRASGMAMMIGTSDLREAEKMYKAGEKDAILTVNAMAYQVGQYIGAMLATLGGEADAIVITGGLAYSELFIGLVKDRVEKMAKVMVYPGEDELLALTEGALAVLKKEIEPMVY